jgi:hypothetical protein
MKKVIAAFVAVLSSAATARGQSAAPPNLCAEPVPAAGTYTTCALWMDARGIRKGVDGALLEKPGFFKPVALTRVVIGDSAKAYAATFDRRMKQGFILSTIGAVLTGVGVGLLSSHECHRDSFGYCTDDRLVEGGLIVAGAAFIVVSVPVQLSAQRAGAKSIFWNNARFAR